VEIFGNYKVEGEISVSAHVHVYRARRTSKPSGEPVCLKVWTTPGEGAFHEDMGPLFAEAARAQAELAAKCPRTWAPVLDHGRDPLGHYMVTPLYPDTLARRLGTVSADGLLLKFVVSRVVAALQDLERHQSRDHGNLKPSKMLIEGSGAINRRQLRLTEPAPKELVDRSVYRNPDLRAIGELIFMLASRSANVSANMYSVPAHTQWPRLGAEEKAWKDLCSDLLDPNGRFQQEGLAALQRELKGLGRVQRHGGRWVALAAVLLLGAMGAGGYFWYKSLPPKIELSISEQYVDYCVAYEDWLREFERNIRRRRSEVADDPHLARTLAGQFQKRGELVIPSEALRMLLPGDPTVVPPELALNTDLQKRVTEAYIFLLDVQKTLDGWPMRRRALEQAGRFRQLQLEAAAVELEAIAKDYSFDNDLFDQLLAIRDTVAQAELALNAWAGLQRLHAALQPLDDPLLRQVPAWQASRLAEDSPPLQQLAVRVDELSRELQPVMQVIETANWSRQFAYDLFRQQLQSEQPALASRSDLEDWARQLDDFRKIPDPRTAQLPPLEGMIREIGAEIARLPQFNLADDHRAFSGELAALQAMLNETARGPAIQRESGRINDAIRGLQSSLNDLNKRVSELISRNLIDPVEWLEKWRRQPISVSGVLAQGWNTRRDAVLAGETVAALRAEQGRAYALERMLNNLRDILIGIDQALPAPQLSGADRSPEMDLRLEPLLGESRDAAAAAMLDLLPATAQTRDLTPDDFLQQPALTSVRSGYVATLESASAFSAAFARTSRDLALPQPPEDHFYAFLDEQVLAADGWIARIRALPSEIPALAAMLEVGRIRGLTAPVELVEVVAASRFSNAARWTAWRRLGQLDALPDTAAAWEQYASAYRAFSSGLPTAVQPLLGGPEFWNRAARAAASLETLESAFAARELFGGDLAALPDRQRFAHFIMQQRRMVDAERSIFSAEGPRVAQWRDAILGELGVEFADSELPAAGAFIEAVRRVDPDVAGERVALATLGPGALPGWQTVGEDADGAVTYRWSGFDLPFRPVDVGAGDLYYLSTVEMPVGLVIQWFFENEPAWSALRAGTASWLTADAGRSGPLTWAPDDEGRPDYVMQWQSVSPRWELLQYARPLPDPRPADEHPIQFIPPELAQAFASSFNCQLPGPILYQTVLRQAAVDRAIWNRRDQTWATQRDHIARTNERLLTGDPPWPDQGAFVPAAVDVSRAAAAVPAVAYDDGQLWFSEVYSMPEPQPFLHLVGNVAEYARDPETGRFYVVGGSALSPPEVQPDVLYPVAPDEAGGGYSDVGFRLAFAVPRNTPGAQLARTILNPQYLEELFPPQ
jgi:hypothetical protein